MTGLYAKGSMGSGSRSDHRAKVGSTRMKHQSQWINSQTHPCSIRDPDRPPARTAPRTSAAPCCEKVALVLPLNTPAVLPPPPTWAPLPVPPRLQDQGGRRGGGGADPARLPLMRSRLPSFLRTVQGWRGTRARGPAPPRRHSSPIPRSHLTWNPTNRALQMLGFKARQPLTMEMVGVRKFLLSPQWPQNNPQKLNP